MPLSTRSESLHWTKYTRNESIVHWASLIGGILVFMYCFQLISANTIWFFVLDAPAQLANMFRRMFPPQWSYLDTLWRPIWDTLVIATIGTMAAVLAAVPLAFMAAKNTTPSRMLVRPVAMFIMVASRSINALIWALLLVTIFGPGVLAGVLAIGLRSIGFIAKLLYEAIEEIDDKQVEAVRSTGASAWHVLHVAIVPQILPAFYSITIYRWDINIRESSVLGIVGAGGIGLYLNSSINSLAWDRVSVILLVILISVLAAETVTHRVRKAII